MFISSLMRVSTAGPMFEDRVNSCVSNATCRPVIRLRLGTPTARCRARFAMTAGDGDRDQVAPEASFAKEVDDWGADTGGVDDQRRGRHGVCRGRAERGADPVDDLGVRRPQRHDVRDA